MKKAIIFGCDQFAEVLNYFLEEEDDYQVCGYTVDGKYNNGYKVESCNYIYVKHR